MFSRISAFFLLLLVASASGFATSPNALRTAGVSRNVNAMTMRLGGFRSGGFKSGGSVRRNLFNIFNRRGNTGGSGGIHGGDNNGGKNGGKHRFGMSDDDNSESENSSPPGLWDMYNSALEANPLVVKALTSLVGFSLGDILAQLFVEKGEAFDWARFARLASFGLLLHGTMGHYFYGFIDGKFPGTSAATVATKVGIDQIMFAPVFAVIFFSYQGFAAGKSVEEVKAKIVKDLKTAVTGSWSVWVPAHTINFRFVPSSQRLLFINSVQIGYNIFLSVLAKS